ncbi:MAG TPA: GNAT family N-acetyltransferase [Casimicrobiaceae bacterium]|jgi:GNAT superfamily N-acetyltransferase
MAKWIEPLRRELGAAAAFRGYALRAATREDEEFLYLLHRDAMREYVETTWGWNEAWQRAHFASSYAPLRNAVIVRAAGAPADIGRLSLTRHWGWIFLRDIELAAAERGHGIGSAVLSAVIAVARASDRHVELNVLSCNPARHLYARLGFRIVRDDGARLRMRL